MSGVGIIKRTSLLVLFLSSFAFSELKNLDCSALLRMNERLKILNKTEFAAYEVAQGEKFNKLSEKILKSSPEAHAKLRAYTERLVEKISTKKGMDKKAIEGITYRFLDAMAENQSIPLVQKAYFISKAHELRTKKPKGLLFWRW